MASYTLKTRVNHTLTWGGKEYRDGDAISLPKAEAERIALETRGVRFVPKDGGDEISMAAIDEATAPSPPPIMPAPPEPSRK